MDGLGARKIQCGSINPLYRFKRDKEKKWRK